MELTDDCLPMESGQLPRQICCAIKLSDRVAQLCCVSDIGLRYDKCTKLQFIQALTAKCSD